MRTSDGTPVAVYALRGDDVVGHAITDRRVIIIIVASYDMSWVDGQWTTSDGFVHDLDCETLAIGSYE